MIAALVGVAVLLFACGVLIGGAGGSEAETGDAATEETFSADEVEALESDLETAEAKVVALSKQVARLQEKVDGKRKSGKSGDEKPKKQGGRDGRRNGNGQR